MRRPFVLATALAAELAVGTLVIAPAASAQEAAPGPGAVETGRAETPPSSDAPAPDPAEPTDPVPVPVRTGRSETSAPTIEPDAPDADSTTPSDAASGPVRTGRLDATTTDAPTRPAAAPPRSPRASGDTPSDPNPTTGRRRGTTPAASASNDAPASPAPAPTASPALAPPTTHVVVPGDHLWAIAAQRVAASSGRAVADLMARDVVTYWVQVCMTNRPHLRSGNPSRIYPGEVVELPPID